MGHKLSSILLGAALILATACQSATPVPPPLDSSQIFELTRLGTVMVQSDFKMHVTVPIGAIPPDKSQALIDQVKAEVLSGTIANSQTAITQEVIRLLLANPLSYVQPTQDVKTNDVEMLSQGSGFFVTPDGYIVTNAHVVAPDPTELKQGLVNTALQAFVTDFTNTDAADLAKLLGGDVPAPMLDQLKQAETQYIVQNMQLSAPQTSYAVEVGSAVPGVVVGQQSVTASIATVGQPTPGKDVAILKIDGRSDLPTLPIGDDATLKETDPIMIVGYPGDATFLPILASSSHVEPTVTRGVLSRRAQMAGGWTALQTDATVHPGNSGGPALDSQGNVIGIATFGTINSQNGAESAGENFLVPVSVIKEFLQRNNIQPQASQVSQLYRQALVLNGQHHYRDAEALFQQVNTLYPGNPWVEQYVSSTEQAILAGQDQSGPSATAIEGGAGVAVVVLIVAIAFWLDRRRTAKVVKVAPAAQLSARACAKCGATLAPDMLFCARCGTPAIAGPVSCRQCGSPLTGQEAFCGRCGTAVQSSGP